MSSLVGPFGQSPQAKYKIMEQPGALPGCCFMCRAGSTNREWFVDLGLQIEFHGAAYICNMCVYEMAATVGWITPLEAKVLETSVHELLDENERLRTQISDLKAVEESIANLVRNRGGDLDPVLGRLGNPPQLSLFEPAPQPLFNPGGGTFIEQDEGAPMGNRTRETLEPGDGEGVGNIRSIGRLDEDS